jgi:hypothetical protein|eukprot:COSAG06_NODE_1430_length_9482_cov_4.849941_6_plen_76_part_00
MPSTALGSGLPLAVEVLLSFVVAFVVGWALNSGGRSCAHHEDMNPKERVAKERTASKRNVLQSHLHATGGQTAAS